MIGFFSNLWQQFNCHSSTSKIITCFRSFVALFQKDLSPWSITFLAEKQSLYSKELKIVLDRMRDTGIFEFIRNQYTLKLDNTAISELLAGDQGNQHILKLDHFKILFYIYAAVMAFSVLVFGFELYK